MRILKGLGSLIALLVLLVGIPVGLIVFAGNPIPSWDEVMRLTSVPDYGGKFFMGTLLPIVAWILWGTFAVGFLVELPAQLRRVPAPRLPGLRLQQQGAGFLIAAVVVMFAGVSPVIAAPSSASAAEPTAALAAVSSTITSAAAVEAHTDTAVAAEASAAPTYTVQDGDSLWRIAQETLGSGERWKEIADLNYGVEQADGWSLTPENWLNAGWVLTLPSDAPSGASSTAETTVETTTVEKEVTVVSGDTLWAIAEQELGDGNRYPEIFDATKDDVQPDGRHLTDPDLIYPGWVVDVPVTVEATVPVAPPAETGGVEDVAPGAGSSETGADAGASSHVDEGAGAQADVDELGGGAVGAIPGATTAPGAADDATTGQEPAEQAPAAEQAADDAADTDWIDEIFNVRTAGGLGALAAAGLLVFLGVRRMKQRRDRKPGQRISMPEGAASDMELALRAVENPLGMDHVDHALRHLAAWAQETGNALPPVYALRLSDVEIALYLDAPAELPAPFVEVSDDKMAWSVDPEELPPLERVPSAPYPALVTLGQDLGDAHVMVDLEHIGALNMIGSDESVRGALTGLAVELATSQWAEDLRITLVGIAPELPEALDTGRFRHVDNIDALLHTLRAQATETERALEELGVDSIEQARSAGLEAESWTPEIVILGAMPDEQARAELADLVTRLPRVGIAAITAGELAGDWTMHLDDDHTAQLQIPAAEHTLPLTPQIVNAEEYASILQLLDSSDQVVTNDSEWAPADEVTLDDLPPADTTLRDVEEDIRVEDGDADEWKSILHSLLPAKSADVAAPPVDENAEEADEAAVDEAVEKADEAAVDETVEAAVGVAVDETDADVAAEAPEHAPEAATKEPAGPVRPIVPLRGAPYVQILGPVQIVGAQGPAPKTPATSKTNQSVVQRATELIAFLALNPRATAVQVHGALWPGKDPHGGAAQQTRNSHTSRARSWLGVSPAGEQYLPRVGAEGYRLREEVRTDWQLWLDLVGEDPASAPTANLTQALRLVKGQPFEGVKEKFYGWAEPIRYEIIAAVGDAAHELATRSLRAGDCANARLAAAVGRMVDPVNEIFWRDALKAEHQAGDSTGVERLVKQLESHLDSFEDGYEAEPETQELIASIRRRDAS